MTDILIIEDDPELGVLIRDFLHKADYSVRLCSNAAEGLSALGSETFRLVLLDIMLPDSDGFSVCTELRKAQTLPVLMMSARADDESKLLGYETGADDYIGKPFSIPLLLAKIRALLKRSSPPADKTVLSSLGITLDITARTVTKNGSLLRLNTKEFDLLRVLMEHPGEALDKNRLFDAVWGSDCFTEPATVSVHIRWLREKLEDDPANPRYIKTVWRLGYMLEADT